MALETQDIEYIKAHLGEWLAEQSLGKPPAVYEVELRERMVRVEEELKHQRELMREGFNQIDQRFEAMQVNFDKRFEAMQANFDKRFEQIDQRFEAMQANFDKRFEQIDQRFEAMQANFDKHFEQIDKRFEQIDKRFEQHDQRFEQQDKRFEAMQQDIRELQRRMDRFMIWSFGTTIGVGGVVIGVLKVWL